MTITQDEAIQIAREVGVDGWKYALVFHADELTALCNKVREQTLLEAADQVRFDDDGTESARKLRRMAGVK